MTDFIDVPLLKMLREIADISKINEHLMDYCSQINAEAILRIDKTVFSCACLRISFRYGGSIKEEIYTVEELEEYPFRIYKNSFGLVKNHLKIKPNGQN